MSKSDDVPTCDECARQATFVCGCKRCEREPTLREKFHSCDVHQAKVRQLHRRIRGDEPAATWFMLY